jgi:hypothetical protein
MFSLDFQNRPPLLYGPAQDHHLDDPSHLPPPQPTEDEELHQTYPLTPLPHTSASSGSAMIPLTEEGRSQTYWKRRRFPEGRGIGSALSPSCRSCTPPSSTRSWRKLCLCQILLKEEAELGGVQLRLQQDPGPPSNDCYEEKSCCCREIDLNM